eukprot:3678825-Prymnesium_polylepis.1
MLEAGRVRRHLYCASSGANKYTALRAPPPASLALVVCVTTYLKFTCTNNHKTFARGFHTVLR